MVMWKAGDRIRAIRDGGCCWQVGDSFEAVDHQGNVCIKPKCFEDNQDMIRLCNYPDHFESEGGPW